MVDEPPYLQLQLQLYVKQSLLKTVIIKAIKQLSFQCFWCWRHEDRNGNSPAIWNKRSPL